MALQFVDYVTPTNTGPAVLARWDEVRGDDAQTEEFINQVSAELQAMATRAIRAQRTIVRRDSAIQALEGQEYLPSRASSMSRWEHFKAAILPY